MAGIQQVSFTSPGYDYGADLSEIERRRNLAKVLQGQSMSPMEVPQAGAGQFQARVSPLQGVGKIVQALAARKQEKEAQQEQRALSTKAQNDLNDVLRRGQIAALGSPAKTINPDPQEISQAADQGMPTPQPVPQAAVAPNPQGAASIYMGHPMTAQLGLQMAQQDMQRKALLDALRGPQGGVQPPQGAPSAAAGGSPPPAYGSPGFNPSAPQGQAAPAGDLPMAGGMPAAAWLAADPTGAKYMEQVAKQRSPINVRPGGTVYTPGEGPQFTAPQNGVQTQWGPQGPTASAVPGAQEALARGAGLIAASQAAAKTPYETTEVTLADGRKVRVPVSSITGQGGGVGATMQPGQGPMPTFGAGGQGQTTVGAHRAEGVAKSSNDYVDQLRGDAASAVSQNRMLDELEGSLKDFNPGKAAAVRKAIAQWRVQAGVANEDDKKIASSGEVGDKITGQLVSNALKRMSARPTQMEFQIFKDQYVPNVAMTPQGAQQVVNFMRQVNNLDASKYEEFNKWKRLQPEDTDYRDFDLQWNKTAPGLPLTASQSYPAKPQGGAPTFSDPVKERRYQEYKRQHGL